MSLGRSFNRAVAKATYDPELEKQLAVERANAREARGKYRDSLNAAINADRSYVQQGKLTSIGATQSAALFKVANDWLQANPDATAEEILDKSQETTDKLATIYTEDKNRLYFFNVLKILDIQVLRLQSMNLIPEETAKKCKELIDKDQSWLEKNPNEPAQTYTDKLNTLQAAISKLIGDPDIEKKLKDGVDSVEDVDTTKEIDEQKKKAEELARKKEELEKQTFNPKRFFKKISGGATAAFWVAFFLALALLGGSLAANEGIVRPLPYRILFFLYGFFFFPVVLLYFGFRALTGRPPYIGAILFPLVEISGDQNEKISFVQKLFMFKANAVVEDARRTYQEAAAKALTLGINFDKVAKEILQENK